MAVEAYVPPNLAVEESDDEEPLVFRRKPNPAASEFKNSSSSVKPDRQPGKPSSGVGNSSTFKGKAVQSSKPSLGTQKSPPPSSRPLKSPPSSSRPSPSPPPSRPSPSPPPSRPSPSAPASRPSSIKPPSANGGVSSANDKVKKNIPLHAREDRRPPIPVKKEKRPVDESEDSDDDKPLSARGVGSQKAFAKKSNNVEVKPSKSDSEDSDDDKPLSTRLDKGKASDVSLQTQKGKASDVSLQTQKVKASVKQQEDSDDEKPLSSRYQMKANAGTSSSKYDDSDEEKPLAFKLQNGSVKRETQNKVPVNSAKRPLGQTPGQSSVKKVKLSEASTSAKSNKKAGDNDDHIPIAQRVNKAASSSGSKSVPAKKKVDASKLKKVNKKSKKIVKKSQYSRSSKELPSSGDVQKWSTLVHSGVIFPAPYQPHGVKMLYDGKPVSLTPEQEEVATMYAVMLETDYVQKEKFNENFFGDWKKLLGRNHTIQTLEKCDFRPIFEWHLSEKEKKKAMSSEEKKALKEEKLKLEEKYMWAIVDGVKEKVTYSSSYHSCFGILHTRNSVHVIHHVILIPFLSPYYPTCSFNHRKVVKVRGPQGGDSAIERPYITSPNYFHGRSSKLPWNLTPK